MQYCNVKELFRNQLRVVLKVCFVLYIFYYVHDYDFIDFLYSAAIGEATQGPKEVAPIVKEGYMFKRGELSLVMDCTFHRGADL